MYIRFSLKLHNIIYPKSGDDVLLLIYKLLQIICLKILEPFQGQGEDNILYRKRLVVPTSMCSYFGSVTPQRRSRGLWTRFWKGYIEKRAWLTWMTWSSSAKPFENTFNISGKSLKTALAWSCLLIV